MTTVPNPGPVTDPVYAWINEQLRDAPELDPPIVQRVADMLSAAIRRGDDEDPASAQEARTA